MPAWSRIHAATAASAESYHHSSSTKVWFFALRSRRRPRPNSRAMMSHVGLAAGSRRAGRARVAHEPFLDVARPVRRWAVVTTVGMLFVRWLRVVVNSPLAAASTRVCGARGLAHELGFRRSRGAPRPRRKPRCSARPTPFGAPARLPRQRRAVDGASVARLLDHLEPDLSRVPPVLRRVQLYRHGPVLAVRPDLLHGRSLLRLPAASVDRRSRRRSHAIPGAASIFGRRCPRAVLVDTYDSVVVLVRQTPVAVKPEIACVRSD